MAPRGGGAADVEIGQRQSIGGERLRCAPKRIGICQRGGAALGGVDGRMQRRLIGACQQHALEDGERPRLTRRAAGEGDRHPVVGLAAGGAARLLDDPRDRRPGRALVTNRRDDQGSIRRSRPGALCDHRQRDLVSEPGLHVSPVVEAGVPQEPLRELVDLGAEGGAIGETGQLGEQVREAHLLPGRRCQVHRGVGQRSARSDRRRPVGRGAEDEQVSDHHHGADEREQGGCCDDEPVHRLLAPAQQAAEGIARRQAAATH